MGMTNIRIENNARPHGLLTIQRGPQAKMGRHCTSTEPEEPIGVGSRETDGSCHVMAKSPRATSENLRLRLIETEESCVEMDQD